MISDRGGRLFRSLLVSVAAALTGAARLDAQTAPPEACMEAGGEVVAIGAGVGIFDVDGTQGRLPDLLSRTWAAVRCFIRVR